MAPFMVHGREDREAPWRQLLQNWAAQRRRKASRRGMAAAQQIVSDNASKSDYEKLKAYKDTICNLTAYNDEAADNISTPYGNPWS